MELSLKDFQKTLETAIRNSGESVALDYIASGFFNESQVKWVESIESTLRGLGRNYYSPREYVVDLSPNSGNRSFKAREILRMNVDYINKAKRMIVNINGPKQDIGTMWELGYACSRIAQGTELELELGTDDEILKEHFGRIIHNLTEGLNLTKIQVIKCKLLVTKSNIQNAEDTIDLMNYQFDHLELSSELRPEDLIKILGTEKVLFLIDNHPYVSYIMMGFMYGLNRPYYTASMRNFGSNVMISASSKGHIMLPGLFDFNASGGKLE